MSSVDDKIGKCVDEGISFLLDAGAGAGKTRSLVQALVHIQMVHRARLLGASQRVKCITYTNVAVEQIRGRIGDDRLFSISTIHEFLWKTIRHYQSELRTALVKWNSQLGDTSSRKQKEAELQEAVESGISITYSDRGSKYLEGHISHDEVIGIAAIMLEEHELLPRVIAAHYPYLFIDEYQDTDRRIVEPLLLPLLSTPSCRAIGLFGDSHQSIYGSGIGEIPEVLKAQLECIEKQENHRCAKPIIDVINSVRTDLTQYSADALQVSRGLACYINYPKHLGQDKVVENAIQIAKKHPLWDMVDDDVIWVLLLTHRLIAQRAGYNDLWQCYKGRGGYLLDDLNAGEDKIIAWFQSKVQPLIELWQSGKSGRAIGYLDNQAGQLASADMKKQVADGLSKLVRKVNSGATIGTIIGILEETELIAIPDQILNGIRLLKESTKNQLDDNQKKDQAFYDVLLSVPYEQILRHRDIFERKREQGQELQYATQHSMKGSEYETVVVVLDDAGARWNLYSYDKYLANKDDSMRRFVRTRNLFYVCCSRAIRNLIVVDTGNCSEAKRGRITEMFGEHALFLDEMSVGKVDADEGMWQIGTGANR